MQQIFLRHLGMGKFEVTTTPDLRIAQKIPEGQSVFLEFKTPKSIKQNKFIHGIWSKAWENQRADKWESVDQLRSDALCAVGYCDIYRIPKGPTLEATLDVLAGLVKRVSRKEAIYLSIADAGDHIQVRLARSWADATHEERSALIEPILAWLCSDQGPIPGADPHSLFNEAAQEVVPCA